MLRPFHKLSSKAPAAHNVYLCVWYYAALLYSRVYMRGSFVCLPRALYIESELSFESKSDGRKGEKELNGKERGREGANRSIGTG